jgi:hypothetical protein
MVFIQTNINLNNNELFKMNGLNTIDDSGHYLNTEESICFPFSMGKSRISKLMHKYLTRKFTEDIDYLQRKGGIHWIEDGLTTSVVKGITDDENLMITRVGVFDSNQPAPEEPISKLLLTH